MRLEKLFAIQHYEKYITSYLLRQKIFENKILAKSRTKLHDMSSQTQDAFEFQLEILKGEITQIGEVVRGIDDITQQIKTGQF